MERVILVSTTPSFITRGDWTLGIEPGVLEQFAKDLAIDYASTLQRFLALQVRGSIRSNRYPAGAEEHDFCSRRDLARRPGSRTWRAAQQ